MENTIVNKIEGNIEKATELIKTKKEQIANEKNNILKCETRMEENLKSLDNDKKEVTELGFNPDNLDEELKNIDKDINDMNIEIEEIIEQINAL
ncbi:MAG: hypothetical protein ACOCRX_04885 [Candidatus Woesearchaeota archaeon]